MTDSDGGEPDNRDALGDGETVYATSTERTPPSEPDAEEPKYRNEQWLRYQYDTKGLSGCKIAEEYGYGSTTIHTWLKKHGIEQRDRGELISDAKTGDENYTDRDWLYAQYHQLGLPLQKIADKEGVDPQTIHRWMDKHSLETRDLGEATAERNAKSGPWDSKSWLKSEYVEQGKSTTQIADEQGVSSSLIRSRLCEHNIPRRNTGERGQAWHSERDYTDGEWLHREYIQKERPATSIADECNVSTHTIYYWLSSNGIPIRSKSESNRIRWGKKNAIPVVDGDVQNLVSGENGQPIINASWRGLSERAHKGEHPVYRDEDWLRRRYLDDELTLKEVSELASVNINTVIEWMEKYGIDRRDSPVGGGGDD